jgi:hypothetical protein
MVYMSGPCSVKGDQSTGINSPGEDVLGNEVSFVPDQKLRARRELRSLPLVELMFALSDAFEPVPV